MRIFTTLFALSATLTSASASPTVDPVNYPPQSTVYTFPGQTGVEIHPPEMFTKTGDPRAGSTLFVDFCDPKEDGTPGCVISAGPNNAENSTSSIIAGGCNGNGNTVTLSPLGYDAQERAALISCLVDVYRPYDVEIVTTRPPANSVYHRAIAAGTSQEAGCPSGIGGIAPGIGNCQPAANVISFSFGNQPGMANPQNLCWTVAQESAHSYGLSDHSRDSRDPMTYITGNLFSGERKFFRDLPMLCGEFSDAPCSCTGNTQNSHAKLKVALGLNPDPQIPAPDVSSFFPADGASVSGAFDVFFQATTEAHPQRGRQVFKVELWVNGTKYDEADGFSFNQRNSNFKLVGPASLADGVQNVEIKAFDDLGTVGIGNVTYNKGAPCGAPSDCYDGQECMAGGCYWPANAGELGESCTVDQTCNSGTCATFDDESKCSSECLVNASNSCPDGYSCKASGATGYCWPKSDGGGCSAGGTLPLMTLLVFGFGFGMLGIGSQKF